MLSGAAAQQMPIRVLFPAAAADGTVSAGNRRPPKPKPMAFVHRERHQQEQVRTLAERNGAVGRSLSPCKWDSSTTNRRGAFIVTGTQCSHPPATLPRPAMDIEVKLEPTALAPREGRRFVARELAALGYSGLVENA
jgi:hypothetical protein